MVMLSSHLLIFQAAPWHAAIKALVSKDTIAGVCPDTGVRTMELVSIGTCGGFWDLSIFFDRRWRWGWLLKKYLAFTRDDLSAIYEIFMPLVLKVM